MYRTTDRDLLHPPLASQRSRCLRRLSFLIVCPLCLKRPPTMHRRHHHSLVVLQIPPQNSPIPQSLLHSGIALRAELNRHRVPCFIYPCLYSPVHSLGCFPLSNLILQAPWGRDLQGEQSAVPGHISDGIHPDTGCQTICGVSRADFSVGGSRCGTERHVHL